MNNFLRELIIIYGSTSLSSLLFNIVYYNNRIENAFKDSKRKLVYKDLSLANSVDLANLRKFCNFQKKVSMIMSIIPVVNVPYTISSIITNKRLYNNFFDKKIEEINKNELILRKRFLEEIKNSKRIPISIKEKIEDKEYLPNEEEYFLVRSLNRKKLNNKANEKKL